jgi:hypothetical protein
MCVFPLKGVEIRGIGPLSEAFSAIFEALRFELNFFNFTARSQSLPIKRFSHF